MRGRKALWRETEGKIEREKYSYLFLLCTSYFLTFIPVFFFFMYRRTLTSYSYVVRSFLSIPFFHFSLFLHYFRSYPSRFIFFCLYLPLPLHVPCPALFLLIFASLPLLPIFSHSSSCRSRLTSYWIETSKDREWRKNNSRWVYVHFRVFIFWRLLLDNRYYVILWYSNLL